MDLLMKGVAKKMHENPSMYSYLNRKYWSRANRKAVYRKIAAELVLEGLITRITPARVKKVYYWLRAQYRRVQKKIRANPAVLIPFLNNFELDVYEHMGYLKYYIQYADSMENY